MLPKNLMSPFCRFSFSDVCRLDLRKCGNTYRNHSYLTIKPLLGFN